MTAAIIDDLTGDPHGGGRWACIADTVMGGVSGGQLRRTRHLTGTVSLANNGGFLQMAIDLAADGSSVDAHAFSGISLAVCGDGQEYGLHLRTDDVRRPWQSYRARFRAPGA